MSEHIININSAELEFIETSYGEKFRVRSAPLASLVGAKKLGYRIAELEPGYRAWPFHSHHVNEEMFFVLNGIGKVRIGQFEYTIKTGDIISAPPGGAEHAHQIINNSNSTLRYLCVSTMEQPDLMEYPDSGKFGVMAGSAPGGAKNQRTFSFFGKTDAEVSYWEGE
ncbi:hypothetical protein RJ44_14950 [Alteromonas macleodii]|uniref:cupin domain-containing protein n=1 Tax=Alteromonas macleodii TaxID=28108 RepID=UPI00057C9216|nr:cupin domain-containing protein [Alteromonas macleodii]KHT57723.1 hypothetical protein RJ44_14950 [Alteromonas macleodii]